MRASAYTILVVALAVVALADDRGVLKFDYFPAGGAPLHESTKTPAPIILIEVETLSDPDLAAQDAILDSVDAESLRLRFVVACTGEVPRHRYATSRSTAAALRSGFRGFRATLLGPGGAVLERSRRPLTAASISARLEEPAA